MSRDGTFIIVFGAAFAVYSCWSGFWPGVILGGVALAVPLWCERERS